MRTALTLIAIAACTATVAVADMSVSIDIDIDDATLTTITYDCATGDPVPVHYVTTDTDVLALVPVDGDRRVFANVVSGSGARYVAGQYEWWSSGTKATLRDVLTDETVLDCAADG